MLKNMNRAKYLLVFLMIFLCSCNHKESVEINPENSATIVNEQTTKETTVSTTTDIAKNTAAETTMSTTAETTAVANESSDDYNQNFKAIEYICSKLWNGYYKDSYDIFNGSEHITYDNEIDFFMDNVSKIENSALGEITDEQDLIIKSKEVFIKILGQDFIEQVEADYSVKNGVKFAIVESASITLFPAP